ncbi:hypothetical protein CBM2623_B170366 [Cupriavidus taiwanensis]|nr:hypothetical protein CBM2608_B140435 [Cupriavidus taiwanensis]SPA33322.1 hypothetical protein CBM2623_B170366 [Cupriavidus taiwanensis]
MPSTTAPPRRLSRRGSARCATRAPRRFYNAWPVLHSIPRAAMGMTRAGVRVWSLLKNALPVAPFARPAAVCAGPSQGESHAIFPNHRAHPAHGLRRVGAGGGCR